MTKSKWIKKTEGKSIDDLCQGKFRFEAMSEYYCKLYPVKNCPYIGSFVKELECYKCIR